MMHATVPVRFLTFVWFLIISCVLHLASLMIPFSITTQSPIPQELFVEFTKVVTAREVIPDQKRVVPGESQNLPASSTSANQISPDEAGRLLKEHPEALRSGMEKLVKEISEEKFLEKEKSAGPVPPVEDSERLIQEYKNACAKKIGDVIQYPLAARLRGFDGQVVLVLFVEKTGEMKKCDVFLPSEHFELDAAALEAAQTAAPFEPFSDELEAEYLSFYTTVTFALEPVD